MKTSGKRGKEKIKDRKIIEQKKTSTQKSEWRLIKGRTNMKERLAGELRLIAKYVNFH